MSNKNTFLLSEGKLSTKEYRDVWMFTVSMENIYLFING